MTNEQLRAHYAAVYKALNEFWPQVGNEEFVTVRLKALALVLDNPLSDEPPAPRSNTQQKRFDAMRGDEPTQTNLRFMECDSCRAKPGSPTLCAGCLNNRRVIEELTGRITPSRIPDEPTLAKYEVNLLKRLQQAYKRLAAEHIRATNIADVYFFYGIDRRELEYEPSPAAEPRAFDQLVRCICNWQGKLSELKVPHLNSNERDCPACGRIFKEVELPALRTDEL